MKALSQCLRDLAPVHRTVATVILARLLKGRDVSFPKVVMFLSGSIGLSGAFHRVRFHSY